MRNVVCTLLVLFAVQGAVQASPQHKERKEVILFDIDGTLTDPRKNATPDMLAFLKELRKTFKIGVVGGSDFEKAKQQLGPDLLQNFDYVFSENGLVAFQDGKQIGKTSIKDELGEEKIKKFVNFNLAYMSTLDIPQKRGTFIEFRTGMFNISPIGRNCSQEERDAFEAYDKVHGVRKKYIETLQEEFADFNLQYAIGGQISFDVFPKGWDKTYCLRYFGKDAPVIHFFGDKVEKGGNDYEIYESPRVTGHRTTGPADTIKQCQALMERT